MEVLGYRTMREFICWFYNKNLRVKRLIGHLVSAFPQTVHEQGWAQFSLLLWNVQNKKVCNFQFRHSVLTFILSSLHYLPSPGLEVCNSILLRRHGLLQCVLEERCQRARCLDWMGASLLFCSVLCGRSLKLHELQFLHCKMCTAVETSQAHCMKWENVST